MACVERINLDIISNFMSIKYLHVFEKQCFCAVAKAFTYGLCYRCSTMHLCGLIVIKDVIVLESVPLRWGLPLSCSLSSDLCYTNAQAHTNLQEKSDDSWVVTRFNVQVVSFTIQSYSNLSSIHHEPQNQIFSRCYFNGRRIIATLVISVVITTWDRINIHNCQ